MIPGLLEHPSEAFAYYRKQGVPKVICEEKHMGSRAVVIVCRDEAAARKRFRVRGGVGSIYTRTGRRFFSDQLLEDELLRRVHAAIGGDQLWDELKTGWGCLHTGVMPWSAQGQDLLPDQNPALGAAAP